MPLPAPEDGRVALGRGAALLLVAAAHAGAGLLLWRGADAALVTPPRVLQVSWVAAPVVAPERPREAPAVQPAPPVPKPRPTPVERTKPRTARPQTPPRLSAAGPATITPAAPVEAVARAPEPAPETPPAPTAAAPARAGVAAAASAAGNPRPAPTPPRFDAAYLSNPPPEYPRLARQLGEQGRVVLRVRVSAEGRAETVELYATSGHARLDDAARTAVSGWRFVPARSGEDPVAAWVLVPIAFNLRS